MTQSKHTPAPWDIEGLTIYHLHENNQHMYEDGKLVMSNKFTAHIQGNKRDISDDELKANAHLMAAAPDLLEALEIAKRALSQLGAGSKIVNAAIAKAKGTNK